MSRASICVRTVCIYYITPRCKIPYCIYKIYSFFSSAPSSFSSRQYCVCHCSNPWSCLYLYCLFPPALATYSTLALVRSTSRFNLTKETGLFCSLFFSTMFRGVPSSSTLSFFAHARCSSLRSSTTIPTHTRKTLIFPCRPSVVQPARVPPACILTVVSTVEYIYKELAHASRWRR
jgi:hypothetical protein